MAPDPTVFIVDDDESVREALVWLMGTVEIRAESFGSGQEFIDTYEPGRSGCLLLDLRMPGMGGLEVQKVLTEKGIDIPVIFLTGHGDVQTAVHAMKAGALDFIEKPFSNHLLVEMVQNALAKSTEMLTEKRQGTEEQQRFTSLTQREREVLGKVVAGKTNKVIAHEMGISIKTVEFHRANMMLKMKAKSLSDVIEKASALGI